MEKLGLNQIREEYLKFFESKGHLKMKSFSLVPNNDPSLLLINAGMAPLKKYFTGEEVPPKTRVTTCQKCIRTPDIENVGKTARHGTFFEMLGNFSFGDYFKEEATQWAWEFITKVMKMPVDKLWVTIYLDDDEAFDIWSKKVGVAPERIVRMGKEDNFWEIGQGPCGPCSEIYFDRGVECGCGKPDCKIGCDCDRFVEFWNLVFTQFDKDENGNYNRLAKPNIDTGMGLERLAVIMQGVNNLFEVDTIRSILDTVCKISGKTYGENAKDDISIRVITDHIRSTTFMISDGVIPSNEGRGYVLRRLLRRAARHGKLLGIKDMFLTDLADVVISQSKDAYSELYDNQEYIKKIISVEEKKFYKTIDSGMLLLADIIEDMKKNNKTVLDGETAFKLHDTYGFPLDLTKEIMNENSFEVDEETYKKEMKKQREQSQNARGDTSTLGWESDIAKMLKELNNCEFIGYDNLVCDAKIIAILKEGEKLDELISDEEAIIITDKTVFYGESGGQAGDTGLISYEKGEAYVTDTIKYSEGKIGHIVKLTKGMICVGDTVKLEVNKDLRMSTARNHSATHLLQKALKSVLGDHVNQAGSFVSADRLRFDFSHFEAMRDDEIKKVEKIVNLKILECLDINCKVMNIEEAKKSGAMALFGEKYGETVRVVSMGDFSKEFCGGTHLTNTSQIGFFKILSESGVAAGVRRIEAATGINFLNFFNDNLKVLNETARIIKINNTFDLPDKINALLSENKENKQTIESLRQKLSKNAVNDLIDDYKEINGVKVIISSQDNLSVSGLRSLSDAIKEKLSNEAAVAVLCGIEDEKIMFLASATKSALEKGVHCGKIIKDVTSIAGGSGGGKPDMAQGGGKDKDKIESALNSSYDIISEQVKG
ncbi:MAG: alanine--tRNA ligase [Clostridia bacterium]|nr:alanine--tRNA ligase [Clostridia bacterium]